MPLFLQSPNTSGALPRHPLWGRMDGVHAGANLVRVLKIDKAAQQLHVGAAGFNGDHIGIHRRDVGQDAVELGAAAGLRGWRVCRSARCQCRRTRVAAGRQSLQEQGGQGGQGGKGDKASAQWSAQLSVPSRCLAVHRAHALVHGNQSPPGQPRVTLWPWAMGYGLYGQQGGLAPSALKAGLCIKKCRRVVSGPAAHAKVRPAPGRRRRW